MGKLYKKDNYYQIEVPLKPTSYNSGSSNEPISCMLESIKVIMKKIINEGII